MCRGDVGRCVYFVSSATRRLALRCWRTGMGHIGPEDVEDAPGRGLELEP